MGKILSFPKEKTKRVTTLRKSETKRLFYTFSVFSLIITAVVIAEKINTRLRPQYVLAINVPQSHLSRAIASQDNNIEIIENIQWGHELIQKINEVELDRNPANIGLHPNVLDQFQYGELAGKYRLVKELEKISEIQYIDSESSADSPIKIQDFSQFLNDHQKLLTVPFSKSTKKEDSDHQQIYSLLDADKQVVGRAEFNLDSQGQLLSLKIAREGKK